MKLSLQETATVLGKSERQVRYLIRLGQLAATKDGGRWQVDSANLPLTEGQRAALDAQLEKARSAVEKALSPLAKVSDKSEVKKSFSVTDLDAFSAGAEIYRQGLASLGVEAPEWQHLVAALTLLSRGCHSFHSAEKAKRFLEAREEAATAVAILLLSQRDDGLRRILADRIEQELIPKISGLVALHEKRSRRSRFEQFGGSRGRVGG